MIIIAIINAGKQIAVNDTDLNEIFIPGKTLVRT